MTGRAGKPEEETTLDALEAELRGLPPPGPPPGLEAKLLAVVSLAKTESVLGRHRRWLALVAVGAAVATAALIIAYTSVPEIASSEEPPLTAALLKDTSPPYIVSTVIAAHSEETRPWDILPPFPD